MSGSSGFTIDHLGIAVRSIDAALEFYAEATALCRSPNDNQNLSRGLQNLGETEVSVGLLAQAARHFAEAPDLATGIDNEKGKRTSLVYTASLRGDVERAEDAFVVGDLRQQAAFEAVDRIGEGQVEHVVDRATAELMKRFYPETKVVADTLRNRSSLISGDKARQILGFSPKFNRSDLLDN